MYTLCYQKRHACVKSSRSQPLLPLLLTSLVPDAMTQQQVITEELLREVIKDLVVCA